MTKKYFCFLLLSFILLHAGTNAFAQKQKCQSKLPSEQISCVVKDLSAKQKRQIEEISKEHSTNLAKLKKQLSAVRDSIHIYIDKQADCSNIVLPLMERESSLQLQFNKEMYQMKLRLDKILTKEQYNTLLNHQHANGLHGKKGGNPASTRYVGEHGDGSIGWNLAGRGVVGAKPRINYESNDQGTNVVKIWVDRNGTVVRAEPNQRGSTLTKPYFANKAKEAAMQFHFTANPDAPETQIGMVTVRFPR